MQICPEAQARAQAPQLVRSISRSRQVPEQLVWPAAQVVTQAPAEHTWPAAQARPHTPQLLLSLPRVTHAPPQLV